MEKGSSAKSPKTGERKESPKAGAPAKGKVLITGVTGFLATWIAKFLLEKGYLVRGSVRSKSQTAKLLPLKSLPHQSHLELVEADLTKPETWDAAVAGCDAVMHIASPVSLETPKDESEIVKPAVEGTMAVLHACVKHPEVKAVVLTSSIASILNLSEKGKVLTEKDWPDKELCVAYIKSKAMAEKAAWEIYNKGVGFRMATINPGLIFGPSMVSTEFSSGDYPRRLLTGKLKEIPKICFPIVDVRDVAMAHIEALERPSSNGQRYICYSGEIFWVEDMARVLREEFGKHGYPIPTELMKECPTKNKSEFVSIRWERSFIISNEKIRKELGITFVPAKEALLEMAHSFIKLGIVPDLAKEKKT